MPFSRLPSLRARSVRVVVAIVAAGVALWALGRGAPSRADTATGAESHVANPHAGHGAGADDHAAHVMSPEGMERWVRDWFATHPTRGERAAAGDAVDTFTVFSFQFSNDANPNDVDTAFVFVGQTVLWKWVNGGHTVTSGTGVADPNAGVLFEQPIVSPADDFAFQFDVEGTVPFFCRPHDGFMRGFVQVSIPTDVVPISDRQARAGFAADPAPNPTSDLATFRFAVRQAGRARVEVYDVRGRHVATPVDRALGPGTYAASWNGRTQRGERATAGVYYLRLTVPGATESREVVLTR